MAKKKKKQTIKINNKVKELMNGDPFDEGIKYLSEDILVELTMLLDLKVPMLVKKEMVRALRQVWSEGNTQLRLHIVNYLDQMNVKKSRVDESDKVSYIVSLLEPLEHDKEEEQLILSAFVDTKFNKISQDKIANKLNYIRQQKLMNLWEKKVDVEFNTLSQIEFYHSYEFIMNEETFYKSLLTTSNPIENDLLLHKDEAYIEEQLNALKVSSIAKKREEIAIFLEKVKNNHKYLSESEIIKLIRSMPPEDNFYEIEIPLNILREIVAIIDPFYKLTLQGSSIVITKEKSYSLYETSLPYTAVVSYGRPFIFHHIWQGEALPIEEDFKLVKKEMKVHFEQTIQDIEEELFSLAEGLELEDKVIEKYILQFIEPHITTAKTLKVKEKVKRRIVYHFMEYIRPLKEKRRKEELLAKTIRDFKNLSLWLDYLNVKYFFMLDQPTLEKLMKL